MTSSKIIAVESLRTTNGVHKIYVGESRFTQKGVIRWIIIVCRQGDCKLV